MPVKTRNCFEAKPLSDGGVGDAAVNLWFLENGGSGLFNLGNGNAESFEEVAKAVIIPW